MPFNAEPLAAAPALPARSPARTLPLWLALGVFAVLWLDLCRQLSYAWSVYEQYAYGWFVPFLALGLLWKRWISRPGQLGDSSTGLRDLRSPSILLSALCFVLCLALLPIRVVHESNPDWPFFSWAMTGIVVFLTLYAIYLAGGWSWVKHFAFPVCFILAAVQWHSRIAGPLTQGLMRLDATSTVELLGWLNIPALQRGNLIELATGTVGVNDACSGIRSFQSSFMAGLFLGELYLLRGRTRLWLLAGGLVLAFALNVVRTLWLSYEASSSGLSALQKWHDPAGFTIAVVTFLALWMVSALVQSRSKHQGPLRAPSLGPTAPALHRTTGQGDNDTVGLLTSPRPFMLACGLWSIVCIGTTEGWYRSHESRAPEDVHWSVAMPDTNPRFERIDITSREVELLKYDIGTAAKWQDESGADWTAFYFRWQGKSMNSIQRARNHRPEICLPGSGFEKISGPQIDYFRAGSLELPVQKSTYSAAGKEVYVFFCLWQDGDELRKALLERTRRDRFSLALEGRRRVGQQTLEIILTGYSSMAEAEKAVRERLPDLVHVENRVARAN